MNPFSTLTLTRTSCCANLLCLVRNGLVGTESSGVGDHEPLVQNLLQILCTLVRENHCYTLEI